jgi:pimeloyl-ACP methyl ester carboxylesterase
MRLTKPIRVMRVAPVTRATSIALLAGSLAIAGCSQDSAGPAKGGPNAPSLKLSTCWLPGVDAQARCGELEVFENRESKTGRKIKLKIAVVPALAASPAADPVVVLAGGPGQSAVSIARAILPIAERLRRSRDLVFVDQRGTGESNKLACELGPKDAPLSEQFKDLVDEAHIKACLAKLDADPTLYTTPIAMDDLDDVRAALGYSELNLWGTSYGTRAALVYLRQHPDHVRSVILDGVAPMSLYLPLTMPRDAERALKLLFAHCNEDAACKRAYPDFEARFRAFLDKLRAAPLVTKVAHPRSGKLEDVTIDYDAFVGALRNLLYAPESTSLVPLAIERAMAGDLGPFVAATAGMSSGIEDTMAFGMFLSVVCAEDAPYFDDAALEREAKGTIVGAGPGRAMVRACKWWPRGTLPNGYRDAVTSDKPVLLLSGELDPVTPPSWAEDAKKTLSKSLSLTVNGVGHNTTGVGCVRKLLGDFVKLAPELGKHAELDAAELDKSCGKILKRPAFFTSYAGPEP